jgi:antitoxin CptB
MREMDILLGRFLERGYDSLDDPGREAFESLLDRPDQDILAWLSGTAEPAEPCLALLVCRMRDVVHGP